MAAKNTNPAIGSCQSNIKSALRFGNCETDSDKSTKGSVVTPIGAGIKKAMLPEFHNIDTRDNVPFHEREVSSIIVPAYAIPL